MMHLHHHFRLAVVLTWRWSPRGPVEGDGGERKAERRRGHPGQPPKAWMRRTSSSLSAAVRSWSVPG